MPRYVVRVCGMFDDTDDVYETYRINAKDDTEAEEKADNRFMKNNPDAVECATVGCELEASVKAGDPWKPKLK